MMAIVCRVVMRPHISGDISGAISDNSGLGRLMHFSSSCSLATKTTSRRTGTKMSVTGMMHAPSSSISMAARSFASLDRASKAFLFHGVTKLLCGFPTPRAS
ncbi:unnamed protein product [Alopecurus aequalis]